MYCAGGSLWDAIRRLSKKGSWSWDSRLQVPLLAVFLQRLQPPKTFRPDTSPLSRAVQILADVAQGLMHMHGLDPPLIHRDVKSPNIFLPASGPDDRARLADRGGTKLLTACELRFVLRVRLAFDALLAVQVYLQGAPMTCVGTPQWMAPEILRGER